MPLASCCAVDRADLVGSWDRARAWLQLLKHDSWLFILFITMIGPLVVISFIPGIFSLSSPLSLAKYCSFCLIEMHFSLQLLKKRLMCEPYITSNDDSRCRSVMSCPEVRRRMFWYLTCGGKERSARQVRTLRLSENMY